MNREIKFRAWDTDQNRMFTAEEMSADQLTLDVNNKGFANIHSNPDMSGFSGEKMIPLQYAGLKDKNGKEIYEGDIIKPKEKFDCGEEALNVYWSKDLLSYCIFQCSHEEEMLVDWVNGCEVIGNIYENPELII